MWSKKNLRIIGFALFVLPTTLPPHLNALGCFCFVLEVAALVFPDLLFSAVVPLVVSFLLLDLLISF
jgi:hypothetical protein